MAITVMIGRPSVTDAPGANGGIEFCSRRSACNTGGRSHLRVGQGQPVIVRRGGRRGSGSGSGSDSSRGWVKVVEEESEWGRKRMVVAKWPTARESEPYHLLSCPSPTSIIGKSSVLRHVTTLTTRNKPCSSSSSSSLTRGASSSSSLGQPSPSSLVQSFSARRVSSSGRRRAMRERKTTPQCSANSHAGETEGDKVVRRIIISGAPASGKGTQCELIEHKFGLVHISTGDLLRAEVAAGTENGKMAKSFMDAGKLVPDECVNAIVVNRIKQCEAEGKGWLIDGYPRSASQATSLETAGIRPDTFILLEVPDELLVDRIVGRRSDPVTGKIYHLTFFPPENEEIAARLTQRSDDTEEKVKARLKTHNENVKSVLATYANIVKRVNGNQKKEEVFAAISKLLSSRQAAVKDEFVGVPTKLNSTPHSREIRKYFYKDVCAATKRAVDAGNSRLQVKCTIPELNPEMDVYRIGTLLELIRELAILFCQDGKRVKVCVQGSMGEGIFSGMPLALAGARRLMESMDWGDDELIGNFVSFGAVGAKEVEERDDIFIIMAPQNSVANCILDDLERMVEAAGKRPVIIVNARLKDMPSSAGVMQVIGRKERMEFADSFKMCYHFRLLYQSGTNFFPIMGAMRRSYPGPYEVYRREDLPEKKERYVLMDTCEEEPRGDDLRLALAGKRRESEGASSFWEFLW